MVVHKHVRAIFGHARGESKVCQASFLSWWLEMEEIVAAPSFFVCIINSGR
jgi:hypothetical protein